MNIQTVADNLRFRIASKEKLLVEYTDMRDSLSKVTDAYQALYSHWNTNVTELEINIAELKRILQDVEQCAKQASNDSWITNPDRMGGCYTEDELRNEGWK
jgi:uncharacterized membrane-anchored protein YhcB (DUF1043 family)